MLSKGRTGTISQAEILTEWQFTCGPQTRYFGNNDAAVPWRGVKSFSKSRTQTKSQLKGATLVLHCGGPLVVNLLLPNPFCSLISASWKWRRFKHLKCLVKSLIREQHLCLFITFIVQNRLPAERHPRTVLIFPIPTFKTTWNLSTHFPSFHCLLFTMRRASVSN